MSIQPSSPVEELYWRMLDLGQIDADNDQAKIVQQLGQLQNALHQTKAGSRKLIPKIYANLRGAKNPKMDSCGMYIYGGVGRGKSMLMDLFFDSSDVKRKRRVHFHSFMLEIHARLHELRGNKKDVLQQVALEISNNTWLLCFDEFQVLDIADAMILGRLFDALLQNGIVMVATSNRHPDDLYKDGLHRARFMPFIEMFKERLKILPLDSKTDYRLKQLQSLRTTYFTPLGKKASNFISETFYHLTHIDTPESCILKVKGRDIEVKRFHGDVAWFDFIELCETPLGAEDYLEIARSFKTILIENISQLSSERHDIAKRFVNLIDVLYENKINLVVTAEVEPNSLYQEGRGNFEFERTISRLIEMQSDAYQKMAG